MAVPALDLSALPISATPKGPSEGIAWDWKHAFVGLNGEVKAWSKRLAKGQPPLTAGEQAKLRSLITTMRALYDGDENAAQIAAWMSSKVTAAGSASLQKTLDAVPAWGMESADAAAAALGYTAVPNVAAVTLAATSQLGPLTADFANMEIGVQRILRRSLVAAIAGGEGAADLAKRISPIVDQAAASGQARSMLIARTTLARAYDQSSRIVYMDAASKGFLYGWRWQARYNSCDVCAALHGTVFPAQTDTFRHPNCRCVMLPIPEGDPASQVAYGQRYEAFDGTKPDFDRLQIHTSKSGWSSWRLAPKGDPVNLGGKVTQVIADGKGPSPLPSITPKLPKAAKIKPPKDVPEPPKAPDLPEPPPTAAATPPPAPPGPNAGDVSAWIGKPRPEPPKPPVKPEPRGILPGELDPWLAGARARYDAYPGKAKGTLEQSNNWSYFQQVLKGDADSLPALDYLKANSYIDDALYQQAVDVLNLALKPPAKDYAAWIRAVKKWEKQRDAWKADYEAWKQANGITADLSGMDGALIHKSAEAGNEWAEKEWAGQKLSPQEKSYLKAYTGSSYWEWNSKLRSGNIEPIKGVIKTIDAAMDRHRISEDVILHRGTGWEEFGLDRIPVDPTALVGSVYRQPGYWSMSVGTRAAFSSKPVQLVIRVPKGTPGVDAGRFSNYGRGEQEVILGRDQQAYVHAVYQQNGKWVVEIEILPEGATATDYAGLAPKPRSSK